MDSTSKTYLQFLTKSLRTKQRCNYTGCPTTRYIDQSKKGYKQESLKRKFVNMVNSYPIELKYFQCYGISGYTGNKYQLFHFKCICFCVCNFTLMDTLKYVSYNMIKSISYIHTFNFFRDIKTFEKCNFYNLECDRF